MLAGYTGEKLVESELTVLGGILFVLGALANVSTPSTISFAAPASLEVSWICKSRILPLLWYWSWWIVNIRL